VPDKFLKTFGSLLKDARVATGVAPGTVNLLGSHTSSSHGFSLAIATPLKSQVEVCESPDEMNHFCSLGSDRTVTCTQRGDIRDGFAMTLFGCLMVLQELGYPVAPVCGLVRSDTPEGSGLSYNAALQVAMLRALGSLFGFRLEEMRLARLAQQVDRDYSGVTCGLIEQVTASCGDGENMLLLDSRELERRLLPLPDSAELLVVDSGVPSAFAEWYLVRKGECEEACRRLGTPALRDVTDPEELAALPLLLLKRARHVVTENARVLEVAGGVSARRFGEILSESHESLRDDYEVSHPAQDLLVELLQRDPRTFGARLTGAGFGGACVALVAAGTARAVADGVLARYGERGGTGRLLIPGQLRVTGERF
jgi:galactokinase